MKGWPAWTAVQAQIEAATKDVPEDGSAMLPWLLEQSQTNVIALLGVLTSATIYRHRSNAHGTETQRLDRLADLVGLNMSKWWRPTAQTYLTHVSKDRIAAVVTEAVGVELAQPLLARKKAQAAV